MSTLRSAILLAAVLLTVMAACADGPREIHLGSDACDHCHMTLTDDRFSAQLLTTRGRSYVFDSIECMAEFLLAEGGVSPEQVGSLWVTPFPEPGRWVEAREAQFLRSPELRSPMGMNLSAFADDGSIDSYLEELGGEVLDWEGVVALVQRGGTHADMEAHAHAGAYGTTILVGEGGEFPTITAALERAEDGDLIAIGPGVYTEGTLTVDRSVTLEGRDWPVLDGEGSHTILVVTAPDVTIRGLTLRGSGVSHVRDHAAVLVEGARGCRIEDNRLEDNFFGIYLARARDCVVERNRIRASGRREAGSGNGIHLWDVRGTEIRGNHVAGHRDGIYLEFAGGTVIRDNVAEDNLRYGLHFMFSDESLYQGNTFRRNGAGVAVMYSRDVEMRENLFAENWGPASYGLLLKDVRDSRIEANTFRRNTTAIFSDGSDRLVFRGNQVARNGWGVKIMASSQDNLFTGNDFLHNTFDVTTNSRRNFNTFRGNHWSAYDGYDLDGDGVGDVPHRPVRLFSLVVQQAPVSLVLLRSFFVELLDMAERVLPVLTPETLIDDEPRMRAWST